MTKMQGSVINRIAETAEGQIPEIGMGCTGYMWTDRIACTIIEIKAKNRIVVQRDDCKMEPWPSGYAVDDSYTPNPEGQTYELIKTKRGWKQVGCSTRFVLGKRSEYCDPSF